ncbi:MAG: hypothetical protein K0R66_1185 [Gammaproteobacteria bacterium]|nr:hypothetical protein [Gammaproteobacteria bacterium]
MSNDTKYTYVASEAEEKRLEILNRICNPYTERFRQVYLPDLTGKTILELGCGTGVMTCYWAKQVGPSGKVIGVDMSEKQLQLAESYAKQEGLDNVEFLACDVRDLDQFKEQYDLVYCRFLLAHLHEADSVLKKMAKRVKPQGFLYCEEISSLEGGVFSDPDSKAFWDRKKLQLKRFKIHNNPNAEIGSRLYSAFNKLGLKNIQVELCQPLITKEEDKPFLFLSLTPDVKKQLVENGLSSAEEFDLVLEQIKQEILGKPWIGSLSQHIKILGYKSLEEAF